MLSAEPELEPRLRACGCGHRRACEQNADAPRAAAQVMDVNVNGVLFTAQAAGRQMERFGNGGSIVLIASMSGSITNKVCLCLCQCLTSCVFG